MLVGFSLQAAVGAFSFSLLRLPGNLAAAVCLLIVLGIGTYFKNRLWAQWLSGITLSVCLLLALLLLGLIMGLIPQTSRADAPDHAFASLLGLNQVTSLWSFILVYALILVNLGLMILRRLSRFRRKDLAFCCNHIGLWLLLASSGLGAADIQRFLMHVSEGTVEWRAYNDQGQMVELPLAIKLRDFSMEEYPPKLAIIHRQTGLPLPEGKADFWQIRPQDTRITLGEWTLEQNEYIHQAVKTEAGYAPSPMPASTPAIRVTMSNALTQETKSGWVCSGGTVREFFSGLVLDGERMLVMTRPEPKRFVSDITVLTQDGLEREALLEVNSPLSLGFWKIYQYGYDNRAGKLSSYSTLELVSDPWLYPVYAGLLLMACGAGGLIWTGTGRPREAQ
jgi:hypothetical protein